MGARGPIRQPDSVLRLRGSKYAGKGKKYRNAKPAVKAPATRPSCPRHLSPEQRGEWKRVTADLQALGLLSAVDRWPIERLVVYRVRWRECVAAHAKLEPLSSDAKAYAREILRLHAALMGLEASLGLTPAARQRLHIEPEKKEPPSPFDEYLQRDRNANPGG